MAQEFFNKKDILLTVRQAASFLNLSIPTVKNYIYSGKLKSVKTPGGHHRISMSELSNIMGINFQEFAINKPSFEIITGLIKVIEKRDFSQGHAESVARLSQQVAQEIRLPNSRKNDLQLASLLHDIGKLNIDEKILDKSTPLTDNEFSVIKKHPQMGEEVTNSITPFKNISPIIRQHHERFDGKGYPDGLSGNKILLEARIIAVCEAFDFMTKRRPYREALSVKEALAELKRGKTTQFDPEIVEIFTKIQKRSWHN